MLRSLCVTAILAMALGGATLAQSRNARRSGDTGCDDGRNTTRAFHCEIREDTVSGVNPLDIDAGRNGGVRIHGWDRGDVLVRTRITGYANSDADARRIVSAVRVVTSGSAVRAEGPDTTNDESWSASFDVQVPRTALLALHAQNGGISIDDFRGSAQFRTRNGGVTLSNVGGDIHGDTTNGGVTVNLEGDHWDGAGLSVETQNGGIRLSLPEHYSAELETGTTNGRINVDFPITVQGTIRRHLTTTLGAGGAKIRAITTNGGVSIRRR